MRWAQWRATRRALLAVAGTVLVVVVAACGSSSSSNSGSGSSGGGSAAASSGSGSGSGSSSGGKGTTIRVAMAQDSPAINIPVWIAQQEGFFKKRGLNVQAATPDIPFSSQLATLGHQYDMVVTSQPDLIRAVSSGIHDIALFGAELDVPQDPAAGLVMTPKSGVTDVKQLAGKSVGAPSLTGNNWGAFECWLQKNGVKPSDVRGVQVAPPQLPDVMSAGRVDGGLIFNPILASLISKGNKSLGDPYQGCFGNGEPNGYYTATTSWANANKDALAKFLAAEKEAVTFVAAHKDVARATYVKLSGLPAKVAAQAVIYPPEMNFKISVADFATWEKIMKSIGQLPSNAPDPSKLVLPLPSAS
jgi:NitT/TauT family transport system substrate-binding protein